MALAPITILVKPLTYVGPSCLVIALAAVMGMLLRSLTRRDGAVLLGQILLVVLALVWSLGRGWLWYGLPGEDVVLNWLALLADAQHTVVTSVVPAPATDGMVLGVTLIAATLAIVVDGVAVTYRAPAAAGLPLLAAYLISAANVTEGLPILFFLAAGGSWLVMVGAQGTRHVRRWGPLAHLNVPERHEGPVVEAALAAANGRRLGLLALLAAVLLPMVLPHLPARYLTEGMARSSTAVGSGTISLSSTIDVSRDLLSRSENVVLRYRTSASNPDPLRVNIAGRYSPSSGQWSARSSRDGQVLTDPSELVEPGVRTSTYEVDVTENHLRAPQLAAPYPVVQANLGAVAWTATGDGDIRPRGNVGAYSLSYLRVQPTAAQLAGIGPSTDIATSLERLPTADVTELKAILGRIVPPGAGTAATAWAIQEWLRGPDFAYSEELAPPPTDPATGDVMDPLRAFLATKRGYCVQYSTAMVLLAQQAGIPARIALGYLPGTLEASDGSMVVRGTDAHAWPELWFQGLGWLRFEPTPGNRTGSIMPAWSERPSTTPGATPSTTQALPTPSPSATDAPTPTDPGAEVSTPEADWPQQLATSALKSGPILWSLVAIVLALLGGLLLPAAAHARRRHRYRRARTDAQRVEAEWRALITRLADLGVVAPAGSTPRSTGRYIVRAADLSGADVHAVESVVATLEAARYAAPGAARLADLRQPTDEIVTAVAKTRSATSRLRAFFLPHDARPR
ncbi:MAG: transglutaminaseTgpA domain-containing protein [Nostocoides sp.]